MGEQTVQVVTDSTSDIPPDLAAAAGIEVAPLTIRFGQEVYADGVDLSGESFYTDRMPGLEFISYKAGAIIDALAGPGAVALVFVSGRKG
ncbi:MAG: DegV family protein [Chloroflexi bacterium]|nr:DegV family protein [Chloroflexota bacterium]